MGADTKALKARIKSVDSSLHLTKAMALVASSKIRRAGLEMKKSREYASALQAIVDDLKISPELKKNPYLRKAEDQDGSKTRLITIAGDRGLAGGYNSNVFKLVSSYPKAQIIPIGRRICDRIDLPSVSSEYYGYEDAIGLAKSLCEDFREGRYDRLGIICTRYISMMAQEAEIRWILPLSADGEEQERHKSGMVFEPDEETVLNEAIPEYVAGMLIAAVRESFASEVAARRMAMDSAQKNAEQMMEDLELQYNRARQSSITQEITEIVAGSGK